MQKRNTIPHILATISMLLVTQTSHAVDSASFDIGTGNKTQIFRLGAQWKWERRWWQSNGTHIGGYWDLSLTQWRGNKFQDIDGQTQNLTDIGITPVFRFQRDTLKGPYLEGGIGAHYLTKHYDNNGRKLSTNFQFGDHLGIGYVFNNNLDIALKVQHYSNGGIRQPNSGVNFAVISVRYPFSF